MLGFLAKKKNSIKANIYLKCIFKKLVYIAFIKCAVGIKNAINEC